MVSTRRAAAERARAAAMAFSKLSGDEQGIILGHLLRNTLEPCLAMYFSSASTELRALLPPAAQQQLRSDYEDAKALCLKVGMPSCKELSEATHVVWKYKGLSTADLATLAKLGSVLPALWVLSLHDDWRSARFDGVKRLAEGLIAGSLPRLGFLEIGSMRMGDEGALALGAALDRGAMPRLVSLTLTNNAIGDSALAALAPALRRRPALEQLCLSYNPFGDEGLAALEAPPPADTPPAQAEVLGDGCDTTPIWVEVLAKLEWLDLSSTQITDAGCATLAAALDSGALPALQHLHLFGIPASAPAKRAVYAARAGLQ